MAETFPAIINFFKHPKTIAGFFMCILAIGALGWGAFGNDAKEAALYVLFPGPHQDLAKAKEIQDEVTGLRSQLADATARVGELEGLSFASLDITARPLRFQFHNVTMRISVRNPVPQEIEFAFGPEQPELIIWGARKIQASLTSRGYCSSDHYCFRKDNESSHRSFVLLPGERLEFEHEFSDSAVDPSAFKDPKSVVLSYQLISSDGKRTQRRVQIDGD